jgi:hypothetical protein
MLNIRKAVLLITLVLMFMLIFHDTVWAFAMNQVIARELHDARGEVAECTDLPSRYSIRSEYLEEAGIWLTFTEDGPTGVDGGLIDLLFMYRNCSR